MWLRYINEDDHWSPLEEKTEQLLVERKREKENDDKLVQLQALPCHDYHSAKDVLLLNTNLFLEKSFSVDTESECQSVCWTGTKLAVVVSPKFIAQMET